MTVAKGFQAIGHACLRHYRLNEALFLKSPHPELLHQCRVALRRLRSALVLFKTLLDDPESMKLGHRLRESTRSFGDGRNIDVLIGRLNNAPLVAKKLALQREQIYAELLVELRSLEFRALILDLTAWINTGAWLSESDTEDERTGPIDRYAAAHAASLSAPAEATRQASVAARCGASARCPHQCEEASLCGGVLLQSVSG